MIIRGLKVFSFCSIFKMIPVFVSLFLSLSLTNFENIFLITNFSMGCSPFIDIKLLFLFLQKKYLPFSFGFFSFMMGFQCREFLGLVSILLFSYALFSSSWNSNKYYSTKRSFSLQLSFILPLKNYGHIGEFDLNK